MDEFWINAAVNGLAFGLCSTGAYFYGLKRGREKNR